jgi:hypothetical protein
MGKGRGRRPRGDGLIFDEGANGLDEVLKEEEDHEARKRCCGMLCSRNEQSEYSPLETLDVPPHCTQPDSPPVSAFEPIIQTTESRMNVAPCGPRIALIRALPTPSHPCLHFPHGCRLPSSWSTSSRCHLPRSCHPNRSPNRQVSCSGTCSNSRGCWKSSLEICPACGFG